MNTLDYLNTHKSLKAAGQHVFFAHAFRIVALFIAGFSSIHLPTLLAILAAVLFYGVSTYVLFGRYQKLCTAILKVAEISNPTIIRTLSQNNKIQRSIDHLAEIEHQLTISVNTEAKQLRVQSGHLKILEIGLLLSIAVAFITPILGGILTFLLLAINIAHADSINWRFIRLLKTREEQKEAVTNYPREGINTSPDLSQPPTLAPTSHNIKKAKSEKSQ